MIETLRHPPSPRRPFPESVRNSKHDPSAGRTQEPLPPKKVVRTQRHFRPLYPPLDRAPSGPNIILPTGATRMDAATREKLFLALRLINVEINQLRARAQAFEDTIKAHPEPLREFQDYERKRSAALQNPESTTMLELELEELRKRLLL